MVNGKSEIEKIVACDAYNRRTSPSGATRGLERLRRIDIEKRTVAFNLDLRHRLIMLGNEVTGADIAVERHQFIEEAARPQDGIAAATVADRDHDQVAAIRREGRRVSASSPGLVRNCARGAGTHTA